LQVSATKIVVLGTGGTIAGTAENAGDNVGYIAAQVGVAQLLEAVAPLRGRSLVAEQVAQLDSKDMRFDVWAKLAERCAYWLAQDDVRGIVITHGTDTLEETAFFLHAVLPAAKPIVLTCAMRPATAIAPDGPQNLLDAVAVASCDGLQGVVAVCAGTVHSALHVQKVHPYRLDAFDSGDVGPLAYVEEGVVRWLRGLPRAEPLRAPHALRKLQAGAAWPRVEIVMNYAGASGATVAALAKDGVQGLVVAATGNGSLHHDLEAALLKAQSDGVRIVRATRCATGQVLPTPGAALADSQGLSPAKARVALLLELLR
jgi:L-asparaginase